MMGPLFALLLSFLAIFLILLVLVQRGRGGGLAGALGGMGGSSAFGAKAGDVFTRITIITASIWIAFCLIALFWAKHRGDVLGATPVATSTSGEADTGTGMLPSNKPAVPGAAVAPGESKSAPASGPEMPAKPAASTTTAPPAAVPARPPAEAPATTTPPASPPEADSK